MIQTYTERHQKMADPNCTLCGGAGYVELDPMHGDDPGGRTSCPCILEYEEPDFSSSE